MVPTRMDCSFQVLGVLSGKAHVDLPVGTWDRQRPVHLGGGLWGTRGDIGNSRKGSWGHRVLLTSFP